MKGSLAFVFCFFFLLSGCRREGSSLSKVHITDQNGFTKTIRQKDRLKIFQNDPIVAPGPYRKVVRFYQKNGKSSSLITTYHENGRLYQSLECVENQACGNYKEWYSNGRLKIAASLSGGIADIGFSEQKTWIFNGRNEAFNEEGGPEASFFYENGFLEGEALFFHPDGQLKEKIPYVHHRRHGTTVRYDTRGNKTEEICYKNDLKEGPSALYGSDGHILSEEIYAEDLLQSGIYYESSGKIISRLSEGNGEKVLFFSNNEREIRQYRNGSPRGKVRVYDRLGYLKNSYFREDTGKEGEEIIYYDSSEQAKLSIFWKEGKVHGVIQSYYPNGRTETRREMSKNRKQGTSTAYYPDGSLMFIEVYDADLLLRGKYYPRDQKEPASFVSNGNGTATLYDSEGIFIRKISYKEGKPVARDYI